MEEKYKVIVGDPFGGYATVERGLNKKEAEKLQEKVQSEVDYFTTVSIEIDK